MRQKAETPSPARTRPTRVETSVVFIEKDQREWGDDKEEGKRGGSVQTGNRSAPSDLRVSSRIGGHRKPGARTRSTGSRSSMWQKHGPGAMFLRGRPRPGLRTMVSFRSRLCLCEEAPACLAVCSSAQCDDPNAVQPRRDQRPSVLAQQKRRAVQTKEHQHSAAQCGSSCRYRARPSPYARRVHMTTVCRSFSGRGRRQGPSQPTCRSRGPRARALTSGLGKIQIRISSIVAVVYSYCEAILWCVK